MIVKLHNLRIKTQLLLLCFVMLAGFIVFGVISFRAVTEIEVNGPVYQRIVQGKNLIADILPPPAHILESYLTMVQIGDETNRDKQEILTKRLRKLREEYYERYRFWQKNLPDGPMKEIIVKKSHEPVNAFYEKFEKEFLPAVFSNDKNRIKTVRDELGRLYAVHGAAVDKLVVMAHAHNSADEALAASIIRKREILLIAIACAMIAAIAAIFLGVRQMLTNNVFRLVSVTERFSSGDLTARSGFAGRDEFSEIGRAFDQMAEKIEQNSIALKKSQEELKRHRDSLEELVKERTGELAMANEQLRQEITDRKRTEEEFRKSEERFRLMVETTSDWVWEVDRNGVYTYASPKIRDLLGYEPEEVIGRSPVDLMPPDEAKRVAELFKKIVESRSSFTGAENVNRHKDGRHIVIETNGVPVFDAKGDLSGYRGIDRDITKRKQVEQDLLKERNQLQILLNFYRRADTQIRDIEAFIIGECIRITESPLGFFGFINEDETLMMTTMWSEKAMEGCAVDFKPIEFSLDHAGIWAEAIREHKPLIVNDYTMSDPRKKGYPDGHVPIKRLMSIPIVKGSRAVAIMAVANKEADYDEKDIPHLSLFLEGVWDMIKRKRAEEGLRTLNERLEQKVEERTSQLIKAREELIRKEKLSVLGQLAGFVGHEIRNPLGVMNNAVYFLKTVMPDADDIVKEYLDIIKHEIDNSQQIITDLLDFARTKKPQASPVAINELIIKVLGKCIIPGNIDVQTDIPDALPEVNIDPFQMGQVLRNLITNAVQAMPKGGVLRISARPVSGSKFEVSSGEPEIGDHPQRGERIQEGAVSEPETLNFKLQTGFIEISITDTGSGISPENMEKLFQPLFTTKTKGIGLGLTICKNIVEANGGRIEVESRLDSGTTFTITLPCEKRGSQ